MESAPTDKKTSLLAGLKSFQVSQDELEDIAPHMEEPSFVDMTEHKGESYYFSGHAGVKVRIETKQGENTIERRRAGFIHMLETLTEYLATKGRRLGIDESFKNRVIQQSLDVVAAVVQNQVKWGDEQVKRRLETKYVFIATVYIELAGLLKSQQGECQLSLGISDLMKCYSHLRLCLGTLTKYLALARQILGRIEIDNIVNPVPQSVSASSQRTELMKQLFSKMLGCLVANQESTTRETLPKVELLFAVPLTKVISKAQKLLSRLLDLHKNKLDHIMAHRNAIQHSFALLYLLVGQLLSTSVEAPSLTGLLAHLQELLPHLSTLNYYSISSCIRMWKVQTLQVFRCWVKSGNYGSEKFLYMWVKQYPEEYQNALQDRYKATEVSIYEETAASNDSVVDSDEPDSKTCSPPEKIHFAQIFRLLLKSDTQTHLRTIGLLE